MDINEFLALDRDDQIAALLELSAAERSDLTDHVLDEFNAAGGADDVEAEDIDIDRMEALHAFGETIGAAGAIDERMAAKYEVPAAPAETPDDKPADAAVEETPTDNAEAPADAVPNESEVPAMAASAAPFEAPAENAPMVASVSTTPRVGTGVEGLKHDSEFGSLDDVNSAFVKKINSMGRGGAGGDGEQYPVVSLTASIGEDRSLHYDRASENMVKIENALQTLNPTALVASGGYCAPLPVNYDIFGVGSAIRPVRDSLPTFAATRGGIRYIAPPLLGAYNNAISLWTAANDANPTDPAVKPSLKVNCASEQTATADAVTLSLVFGNLMTRAFPELVQRHNQLALIQHARFAERTLLNKISALSTKVTSSHKLGAARDLLLTIAQANAAYRNRHRIPPKVRLRAIMPEWVRDLIREDIASNLHVENMSISDSVVDGWFSDRGLNISWHIDDTLPSQANNAPLNALPSTIKFWIFSEGTFLFLDGGTLDLGVIRDSTLVGTNDYRTFVETFEGIAKVGIESLEVTATTGIAPLPAVTP